MNNISNLLTHIEETSRTKKHQGVKIGPYSLGILEHFGKIYTTGIVSNWYGTISGQIGNIQKIKFSKLPTANEYYKYMYKIPIESGLPWKRSPIGVALTYKNHEPTKYEYSDFKGRVTMVMRWLSKKIIGGHLNRDDLNSVLDSAFKNKDEFPIIQAVMVVKL